MLDPSSVPFWEAAARHELVIQRCQDCDHHQFYPRPFCLACLGPRVAWVPASGRGTVYSLTTVRIQLLPELVPPYQVALVALEEGPHLLAGLEGLGYSIGEQVHVAWREREGAPPLPVFARSAETASGDAG